MTDLPTVFELKTAILNQLALHMAVDDRTATTGEKLIERVLNPVLIQLPGVTDDRFDSRNRAVHRYSQALHELARQGGDVHRETDAHEFYPRYWLTGALRQRVIEHYGLSDTAGRARK